MKTSIALFFTAFLLSSCYVENVQPRYDYRDRVIGYYEVEEYSNTYDDYTYYSIDVNKSSSYSDEIYFDNFYGVDIRVHAIVNYDNNITIPLQERDGYRIEGSGTIHGNEIHLVYSVRDLYSNTRTDFCEMVASLN